jgi:hypothetical protein
LHRRVVDRLATGVEHVGNLAAARRTPLPQHFQDRQLGIGDVLG